MISNDTLTKLEFQKLLDFISKYAHSESTRVELAKTAPLFTKIEIQKRFSLVEDIRNMTRQGVGLSISEFDDIREELHLLRPEDSLLNTTDLMRFIPVFRALYSLSRQISYRDDIPHLKLLAGGVTGFPDILESLERTIDKDGAMLDTASRLLFEIRQKKRSLTARIRKRLEEIVRERSTAIFLQDDFITQRSGRWVIPVRMDSKGMVPGVVHDVSNTGETAFMEPIEIISMANDLENLSADEKGEQIRILREICGWIREESEQISGEQSILIKVDLLNSIASVSDMLKSEIPNLSDSFGMKLVEASHPLLLIRQIQGESGEVVPLDMELDNRNRIMVITGPNTGGKTIAIKTAGLLCIMALSGIPVPASSTSLIPMVSSIFTDIGDEQAIESSLSTFSSHISRIASILEKSGKGSLVLLDELGTGTEPIQGAALACAILLKLQNHGSIVLATTHLTEIVGYVHKREGMINAAMEFDRKSLLPLYRLRSGEPGESHAIETARRYGIPGDVIEYAQELAGKIGSDFQSLLTELKVQRQDFENRTKELEDREILLHQKEVEIKAKAADMEQRRSSMMDEVLREKKELIQTARKELNLIIDEGRREKREAAALDKLRDKERDLDNTLRSRDKTGCLDPGTIRKGTKVRLNSIGCDAIVLKTDPQQGKVRVRAGSMEMEVAIEELSPPDSTKRSGQHVRATTSTTEPEPLREINLIGMHLEEAIARLEQFINQASISASGDVRIIHGIGTGTLRRGIREHLKRHPLVASYREGERYEGAGGATVAKLA